ncbi:MAG: AAA family ATPase [Patescibacteria group bacterium]
MKQPSFIVLEGLNGVGKTTISKLLVERLNGIYITTPSSIFQTGRVLVDKSADPIARFLFYLAGVYQTSIEIAEIIGSGQTIVCDRYYHSTVCSNRAAGLDVEIPQFVNLIQPDFTFLVTCEQNIRLSRLSKRGMGINDIRERKDDIEQRTVEEFRKFRLIEVDNTISSPIVAVEAIIKIIGG